MIVSGILILVVIVAGVFLLVPPNKNKNPSTEEVPDNSYKNETFVVSGPTPLELNKIVLSDELLIVEGKGITQNTHISISGKNYLLTYVDEQTAIYRGFDQAMDEDDIIKLAIIGEREKTVFSETEAFQNEKIEYGIETLPQNVQDKLNELEALEASPTPTVTTTATAAVTASPKP